VPTDAGGLAPCQKVVTENAAIGPHRCAFFYTPEGGKLPDAPLYLGFEARVDSGLPFAFVKVA
jgi:hypothetical protein